jgi:hypothetical protein
MGYVATSSSKAGTEVMLKISRQDAKGRNQQDAVCGIALLPSPFSRQHKRMRTCVPKFLLWITDQMIAISLCASQLCYIQPASYGYQPQRS